MQQGAQLEVDYVIGPYGPLSAANLPTSKTKRWNIRRKAEVVAAVHGGLLSFEEARSRYAISAEELRSWQCCIDQHGLKGLRAVHTQSGRAHNLGRHIPEQCKAPAQSSIRTGDLVVKLGTQSVEVNGTRVHLTRREYQLLELLSLRKSTTLTKAMLLDHLYGGFDEPEQKIIEVFICKLRKKLANASNGKDYLQTVWGRGYMLCEPQEKKAVSRQSIYVLSGDASARQPYSVSSRTE